MPIAMVMTAYGQQARYAANQLFNGKAVTTWARIPPSGRLWKGYEYLP